MVFALNNIHLSLLVAWREDEEQEEEEEEEEGGEDPYKFSLGAVIDECATMASREDQSNPGASSSGSGNTRKRKIVQNSYFSNEEDED